MSRNFYWQRPNQWGWWKLDDDATDSSGNARDGTASGVTYGPVVGLDYSRTRAEAFSLIRGN